MPDALSDTSGRNLSFTKYSVKTLDSNASSSNSRSSKVSLDSNDSFDTMTVTDGISLNGHIYPVPLNTPVSIVSNNSAEYIAEALDHAKLASTCETNKEYEDAFAAYKQAIDILLKHVKGLFHVILYRQ